MVIKMRIKSNKGLSAILTTMFYLLIAVVILGIVTASAIELISHSKEEGNYRVMLDSFIKLKSAIEDTVQDKQDIEMVVINPGEINIDCNNNIITGEIEFLGEYREDVTLVKDIVTYKNNNTIYFEYSLDNYTRITLDCNSLSLAKSKNNLNIKYLEYDEENDKILVSVDFVR